MRSKQKIIADSLLELGENKKILDIGFAQDPNVFLHGEVYGVDIYPTVLPDNYHETKQVDLNNKPIPYPEGFFEAALMGCTLAHLVNPLAALCETNRVLK